MNRALSLLSLVVMAMVMMASLPAAHATRDINPICVPKFELTKEQCGARIATCSETEQAMAWLGDGSHNKAGKQMGDGGCQCAFYCGFKTKKACESSRYSAQEITAIKENIWGNFPRSVGQRRCQWNKKRGCSVPTALVKERPYVFENIVSFKKENGNICPQSAK